MVKLGGTPLTKQLVCSRGGSQQLNIGWALFSYDGVIKSVTYQTIQKIGGAHATPPDPLQLPPWFVVIKDYNVQ